MTVAVIQSKAGALSTVTFDDAPTAGNTLILGVTCYQSGGGQTINTPAGWTAVTPVYRNEQPGWAAALAGYSNRVFWKVSDGTETTISNPASAANYREAIIAEVTAGVGPLDYSLGWNPHPGGGIQHMPIGNLSSEGWPTLDIGAGADALFVGYWTITDGLVSMTPAIDQAGGSAVEYSARNALVVLPVNPTTGGVRLTGVVEGLDNFPAWALMAFSGTVTPPTPEPGVVIDPTAVTPIPIGEDIISWRITRGASAEITGGAQPGTLTLVVKNSIAAGADSDDKYNPENGSSPLISYLRDGTALWVGVNSDGKLSGVDPRGLFGGRITDITVLPAEGASVAPTVEILVEDALGWMSRVPVRFRYAAGRSQGELRAAILAVANETRTELAHEILTLPLSAAEGDALALLEELNKANGTRHYARPENDFADWYTYVTRNRQWRLDATSDYALSQLSDHVTGTSGWRQSADTVINQQRASVVPIVFNAGSSIVWRPEALPLSVTPEHPFEVWPEFDDYVSTPIVDTAWTGSTPTITLTAFGTTAHLTITVASGTATFTNLTIQGPIARRAQSQSWVADDLTSQALPRGVRAGSDITSEYVGTLSAARGIAEHVVWRYAQPQVRPTVTVENWFPDMFDVQMFDIVAYTSPQLGVTSRLFEVVGQTHEGHIAADDVQHHTLTLVLQECFVQADPGWFVLDTSELDSTDILAY